MIHYNGQISKTPGALACDVVSPQAVSGEWRAVDCDRCKTSLVGLTVERTALDMPERFEIAAIEPYRFGLAWSDDAEADVEWRPLVDLDGYDIDANAPMWRAVL